MVRVDPWLPDQVKDSPPHRGVRVWGGRRTIACGRAQCFCCPQNTHLMGILFVDLCIDTSVLPGFGDRFGNCHDTSFLSCRSLFIDGITCQVSLEYLSRTKQAEKHFHFIYFRLNFVMIHKLSNSFSHCGCERY